ncbi:MAG TPA: mannosyltransferase family protein [Burkholderiales bacterium]|nr:mannosyltransferase family protein [Burkholderiales bacterium]
MGKLLKIHWLLFCIIIFVVSRLVMLYQYNLMNNILLHYHNDFFKVMCKWDCEWYITIIKDGYDVYPRLTPKFWHGLANWAFFPLYPYIVKIVIFFTNTPPIATGVILNQIFIFMAFIVFYKYLKLFVDELNSRFGVLLLAFSPFSIYFASIYTEALFLLLSLSAFYLMRINKPILSAVCGGLLSATRPVGIMFSLTYLYFNIKNNNKKYKTMLGFLLTTSGLLLYMLYLYFHTGDALAFKHIQQKWGRVGFSTQWAMQLYLMIKDYHNSLMFLISCILSIYLFFDKHIEEAIFNLLCILPGVLTGQMISEARFSGTLFTFYFGLVLLAKNSRTLKLVFATLFLIFYISYFLYWMAHASFLI